MKELIFIRHGETDHNVQMRFTGHTDIPLNETGRSQARSLHPLFSAEGVIPVYASDLARCRETAELVSGGAELIRMQELREVHFGIFETLSGAQISEAHPDLYRSWRSERVDFQIPQGESYREMSQRVIGAVEKILDEIESKAAVVTHSGCIRALLSHYLLGSIDDPWRFVVDNCTITRLCFDGNYAYLKSLNVK